MRERDVCAGDCGKIRRNYREKNVNLFWFEQDLCVTHNNISRCEVDTFDGSEGLDNVWAVTLAGGADNLNVRIGVSRSLRSIFYARSDFPFLCAQQMIINNNFFWASC